MLHRHFAKLYVNPSQQTKFQIIYTQIIYTKHHYYKFFWCKI
jgi:hypothetical protein